MKNLKTVTTLVLLTFVVMTGVARSEAIQGSALSSLIYEDSSNMFAVVNHKQANTNEVDIRSYGDDFNKDAVWSTEYEEYVSIDDFRKSGLANTGLVNRYIKDNPTASGEKIAEVFKYNETAGEYHLQ